MAIIQKEPHSQHRVTVLASAPICTFGTGWQYAIGAEGISFSLRGDTHKFQVTLSTKEFEELADMAGLLHSKKEKKTKKKPKH